MTHPYRQSPATSSNIRRELPRGLRRHLLLGRRCALFSLTVLLFMTCLSMCSFGESGPRTLPAYDRTAPGQIVRVEKADSAGGSDYEVTATYVDEHGNRRDVRSYANAAPDVGRNVTIRYQHDAPRNSVIDGLRAARNDWWHPLAILLLALGAVAMSFRRRENRKALRLMQRGAISPGTVVDRQKKSAGDDGYIWTIRFELTSDDRLGHVCELQTRVDPPYQVGETWPVLYDRRWPDDAMPVAHLPGSPKIEEDGRISYTPDPFKVAMVTMLLAANALLVALWIQRAVMFWS